MKFQSIYFVAGEVSADNHGAALMRALRELDGKLEFVGRGGPQMQAMAGEFAMGQIRGGGQFKNWIGEAAVLGLWEVFRKYGYFRKQFHETLQEIRQSKPDAVVLIDYPGFNLRLAGALRRQAPLQKIIYYISPQVWAWNRGRITRMAHLIDLVLCIFPFEVDLYRQAGLRALFVGHPMIERLRAQKSESERDPNLIGLFPGSRSREVRKVFPVMLETARELQKHNQNLRFEVAAASEALAREMNPAVARFGKSHEQSAIEIKVGETAAIMQRAWAGIIASGSATLEAAYFRLPFVLIYKVAWPTYFAARLVVNVKYLGMPNLLADTEIVPEFIQYDAKPSAIVKAMQPLIEDADAREGMIAQFDTIVSKLQAAVVSSPPGRSGQRSTLVGSGASETAARAIIEEIEDRGERI
jgi:lipid-A-disaccharide synthase